ncbi:tetratricopeptide repeat protein, partial [Sphingopyxis sp.]|uniref:tetratricopeptide repeat protein n=1 Tax=Sphingopyxis sp. TaxID=1908224 RepID=UPI002EDADEC2
RYSSDPAADRAKLDGTYADAMLKVAARFPTQDDIAILAAEAVMDTHPWDYWETDGRTPKGKSGEAVTLVERVMARNASHAQAAHLYIHLMEATDPGRALAAADRLSGPLVPAAGHLVHMPSHIYYRVGRFADSVRVNVDAARADEAWLKASGDTGMYRYGYYPHNVHFIVASAQMAGDMKTAIGEAERLGRLLNTDVSASIAWIQPINAATYLAHAQFARPAEILALPAPDARLPYVAGMRHYARAVAYAQQRDDKRANAEISAIARIRTTADFKPMTDQLMPAPDLLRLAEAVARGRLAYAHRRYAEAARHYREAIAIEDAIPYIEPPYWYYPVRQSLGAALYRAGDFDGARQAFLDALARSPDNGWALYGLATTQRALGDRTAAAASNAALDRAWRGDRRWLSLDRL